MARIAVVGATSWGTTLAVIAAGAGQMAALLTRTAEEAAALRAAGENARFLPGVPLPPALRVTADAEEALRGAEVVVLAVPSQTMRQNVRRIAGALPKGAVVVSAAKGLEVGTGLRMSEVIREELPEWPAVAALSGPNLAREIARGLPAASVVAGTSIEVAEFAQARLRTPFFRVYAHDDLIGVELGGTLKNVIALGAGMADGMEVGDNAKAAFITRGVAEMTRLGTRLGAHPLTFASLAGLGDLIATCYSRLSRNRHVGEQIARGRKPEEVLGSMTSVAEGVPTTRAARALAARLGVEMPITEMIYRVLFEQVSPQAAVIELMQREPKRELAGIWEPAPNIVPT